MKDFAKFMKNVGTNIEKRVEHIVNHFVEISKEPHPTQEEYDSLWKEIKELHKDLGAHATDAANGEIKEHVVGKFESQGMSKEEAEKWFEQKWKEVKDLADKAKDISPKHVAQTAAKSVKLAWLKVFALASAAVGLLVFAILPGINTGRGVRVDIDQKTAQLNLRVEVDQQQFDQLIRAIPNINNLPSAPEMAEPTTPTQPMPQAAVPLPMPVAAIAATPVTATIETPASAPQTVQTDIGTVYRSVPQARHEIEFRASEPHHEFHGNINVTAPFGAHVGLSW